MGLHRCHHRDHAHYAERALRALRALRRALLALRLSKTIRYHAAQTLEERWERYHESEEHRTDPQRVPTPALDRPEPVEASGVSQRASWGPQEAQGPVPLGGPEEA